MENAHKKEQMVKTPFYLYASIKQNIPFTSWYRQKTTDSSD
jgi:hypothetical protein